MASRASLVRILFREPPESAPVEEDCRASSSCGQLRRPPVTLLDCGFGRLENSYVYTALAGYLLMWYLISGFFMTQKLQDRVQLLLAWCCVGAGTLFLILTGVLQGRTLFFWEFCVGSALVATSIPFFGSATGRLFSEMHSNPSLRAGRPVVAKVWAF
jgi:hypothetical protein